MTTSPIVAEKLRPLQFVDSILARGGNFLRFFVIFYASSQFFTLFRRFQQLCPPSPQVSIKFQPATWCIFKLLVELAACLACVVQLLLSDCALVCLVEADNAVRGTGDEKDVVTAAAEKFLVVVSCCVVFLLLFVEKKRFTIALMLKIYPY